MLYHHTKGENLHISLALRARENMNFPPSGDDITHIRRNKQISSIYFMLIDEILIFISEIESVSVTDITHSVTDIGLSDYFHCLPSYFCTSCLPLLVTAGTRQQSS